MIGGTKAPRGQWTGNRASLMPKINEDCKHLVTQALSGGFADFSRLLLNNSASKASYLKLTTKNTKIHERYKL